MVAQDIQVSTENDLIRVVYRGEVEYVPTNDMLRQVGELARRSNVRRLLFDIRAANYQFYHAGTIRHAEEGPDLGIDRSFRIAFLGAPEHPMLDYVEAATVNRGYHWAKAFTDEAQALAWLRAPA